MADIHELEIRSLRVKWLQRYKDKGAFWLHDGNPAHPHALLASGNHSNGFFNSRLIIADDECLRAAAVDIVETYIREGGDIDLPNRVVGPATGATKFAEAVAHVITLTRGRPCDWASPEKVTDSDGTVTGMTFVDPDCRVLLGERILLCEDVLTTGGSVDLAANACDLNGALIVPYVLMLVNRSGLRDVHGKRILALVDQPMLVWNPNDPENPCELCVAGSSAIKPKDRWLCLTDPDNNPL